MTSIQKIGCYFILVTASIWLSGCITRPRVVTPAKHIPEKERITLTGYTVQVGAFSIQNNARMLTQTLIHKGLNAFYFRHESGLYKVSFGDFPSREAAHQEAERLLRESLIEDYFVIKPEDYAVSSRATLGPDYLREKLVSTAERFIGVKYSWGGASKEAGFDCSGLTMAVYQLNGLNLPRSSKEQYSAGIWVARDNLKRGDLVFFDISQNKRISHVGIYIGKNVFIHAPGKDKNIRKDSLSNVYFRKRYAGARTYLEE